MPEYSNIKVSPERFEQLKRSKPDNVSWDRHLQNLQEKAEKWDRHTETQL